MITSIYSVCIYFHHFLPFSTQNARSARMWTYRRPFVPWWSAWTMVSVVWKWLQMWVMEAKVRRCDRNWQRWQMCWMCCLIRIEILDELCLKKFESIWWCVSWVGICFWNCSRHAILDIWWLGWIFPKGSTDFQQPRLAQQQSEVSAQNMQQVSDILRSELSVVKDTQTAQATRISESVTETMSGFSQQVNENLARVEASLEKIFDKEGKPEGRKPRADRG